MKTVKIGARVNTAHGFIFTHRYDDSSCSSFLVILQFFLFRKMNCDSFIHMEYEAGSGVIWVVAFELWKMYSSFERNA